MDDRKQWWDDAVVYQVYLRSFTDSDGDGVGDLPGLISRLDYLRDLGIDALWLNPCYQSPQVDHGYDISDYYAIDPQYGSMADFDQLVSEARARNIQILMDMVANHCSSDHPWFKEALAAEPGSRERARFHFQEGRGSGGELPPNNWLSVFGGLAWTRIKDVNDKPGQWYLHSFDSTQPDFNWDNEEVRAYFDGVLKFWFDKGVAGFRVDVAHGMVKAPGLPDFAPLDSDPSVHNYFMWDQDGVHDIYRRWRRIGDSYEPDSKYFVGEIWVPATSSVTNYLRPDEMHQAFSFDLLVQPWSGRHQRAAIEKSLREVGLGKVPAWALSNHDVHRTVTRYGQEQDLTPPPVTDMISAARRLGPDDLQLGTLRARAAAMILLALPGTPYLYQGEELGLPEVLDLPNEVRQDPIWKKTNGAVLGRDGCRVPLPWSCDANAANMGFSAPSDAQPAWLPQPAIFADLCVCEQESNSDSMLNFYRKLIRNRRLIFGQNTEPKWLTFPESDVLAFRRGDGICAVNFADDAALIPSEWGAMVLRSQELASHSDVLRPNEGIWLSIA